MEELLKALLALGPGGVVAGVMFYLWRDERAERRETSVKLMQVLGDSIEAENGMTNALNALSSRIKVSS